ncbi:MAG TPA: hypothetical protein VGG96_10245, partial [Steroidobacteraceae bacterium]
MVKVSIAAGLALAVLWWMPARGAAQEVPAAAFAALPQTSEVELSPNGGLIAWRDQTAGTDTKVAVYDIAAKNYRRIITVAPTLTLRALLWADDDTLLLQVTKALRVPSADGPPRLYTYFRSIAADITSGSTRMLLMSGGERDWVTGAELVAWQTAVPHTVIMSTLDYSLTAARQETGTFIHDARSDSGWIGELFQVDTRSGKGKVIEEGDAYTKQWVVNAQGAAVARSEYRPAQRQYVIEAKVGMG